MRRSGVRDDCSSIRMEIFEFEGFVALHCFCFSQ